MNSINLCKYAAGFPDFFADELLPDLFKKKIGGKMVHVYYTGFYQKYKPDKFVT